MDNCVLRWDGFSVVVRLGYDEAANAELRRACPQVRWNSDAGGFVVRAAAGLASLAVLDFAARHNLTVSEQAQVMLDRAAVRARESLARKAEQAAWDARPARPIALVRRLVGPVVWLDRFACSVCDDWRASGWTLRPRARIGGQAAGCELRHLHLPGLRARITPAEIDALVTVLDAERAAEPQRGWWRRADVTV